MTGPGSPLNVTSPSWMVWLRSISAVMVSSIGDALYPGAAHPKICRDRKRQETPGRCPMRKRPCIPRLFVAAALLALSGCASMGLNSGPRPLRPVPYVDLPRYMGGWYVIANIPYFAEKDCHDSVEGYVLRP